MSSSNVHSLGLNVTFSKSTTAVSFVFDAGKTMKHMHHLITKMVLILFCLFDLVLYVLSTIFQL